MQLFLETEITRHLPSGVDPFDFFSQVRGTVYRNLEGRCTYRITLGETAYFVKLHQGIGWRELLKNLFQLRWPVVNASNEWMAIRRLTELGVKTLQVVGYGNRGINPVKQLSFLITKELTQTRSLEDLCTPWIHRPPPHHLKLAIIRKLARIAKRIHENGLNHRDFYLCHFLLDISMTESHLNSDNLTLFLVDLHRAQIRKKTPYRWIVKDLGGLFFSALDTGLTKRDILRFMEIYTGKPPRRFLVEHSKLWADVKYRARRIYRKSFQKEPPLIH